MNNKTLQLTEKQSEFLSFLRGVHECELRINVVAGEPADWFLSFPYYHNEYFLPDSLGQANLTVFEEQLIEEMQLIDYGELYISKRNQQLVFQGGLKHFKSGQFQKGRSQ